MNDFKMKKDFLSRNLLYKVLIFIATVAVIVYFMPRDGKFNYQFDIGKPWKYGQLMATFDFPIYKDDKVVEREQDSLLQKFQPFFNIDRKVEANALGRLQADYQNRLKQILPANYFRYVQRKLTEIYEAGILPTEQLDSLRQDSIAGLMAVDNKLANQRNLDEVFSVKTAYHAILKGDTVHYRPDILQACALNDYLAPNLQYDRQRSETARQEILDNYSWASGIVLSGQKIIDRGEIINAKTYNILESFRKESIKRSESVGQRRLMLAGQVLYVSIFMLCFMLYLDLFRKQYYSHKGGMSLLFACCPTRCSPSSSGCSWIRARPS